MLHELQVARSKLRYIKELLEGAIKFEDQASPAPWRYWNDGVIARDDGGCGIFMPTPNSDLDKRFPDAKLTVELRNALPKILDVLG